MINIPSLVIKKKLLDSLHYITTNNIKILYTHNSIELVIDNQELGYFTLSTNHRTTPPTYELSISVDHDHLNHSLARLMIFSMFAVNHENMLDKIFYIDTDASNGFWDYIGMKLNHKYDNDNKYEEGSGYEKYITYQSLLNWTCGSL